MADERERNQGIKQGTGEGSGQQAPGRNPQDDRSAGGQQGGQNREPQHGGFDPERGGDGAPREEDKEGGQNESTRR
jgi:hypothetical protein